MDEGHKISRKQNLFVSTSCTLPAEENLLWCCSSSSWASWHYVRVSFHWSRTTSAALLIAPSLIPQLSACIQMFMSWFLSNLTGGLTPMNDTVWYQFKLPWPLLQITGAWKSKICAFFLTNFSVDSDESLREVAACVFFKTHSRFKLHNQYSREKPYLDEFIKNTFYIGMHSEAYEPISFNYVTMTDTTTLSSVLTSLNALDIHSRLQEYEKARKNWYDHSIKKWHF